MNRLPEVEILPACEYYGLGVVPSSPLARGVLTGKYQPGKAPPKGSRAGRQDRRMLASEFRPASLALAPKIKQPAAATGMTAPTFPLKCLLAHPLFPAVLACPRTLPHAHRSPRPP